MWKYWSAVYTRHMAHVPRHICTKTHVYNVLNRNGIGANLYLHRMLDMLEKTPNIRIPIIVVSSVNAQSWPGQSLPKFSSIVNLLQGLLLENEFMRLNLVLWNVYFVIWLWIILLAFYMDCVTNVVFFSTFSAKLFYAFLRISKNVSLPRK